VLLLVISLDFKIVTNWQSELQLEWQGQLDDLVTAIACAPNGLSWAASSAAGEVVWNPRQGDLVKLQAVDGQSIEQIAFSADSRWLAAGGQAGSLSIWNCEDFHQTPKLVNQIKIGKWIEHLAWHPIESQLAISHGSQLQIWDIPKSSELATDKFDKSSIFALAWHPTGAYLAMAGYKGIQIWTAQGTKEPIQQIELDTASLEIAWSRDGCYLAIGNLDCTLTIVDWHHPTERWTLTGCPGKIRQICWIASDITPCLAVASGNTVVLWQLTADSSTWEGQCLEGHQDIVTALAAHPQCPIVAAGGADGYTCLWSVEGEIYQIITAGTSQFTALSWQPNSEYLLTGSQLGSIDLWAMPA
jgi:WD40 repeat protein